MALFRRATTTTDENTVPADLQQYYSTGPSGYGRWILRIVLALAVLALLVWSGIWLFNKLSNRNETATNNPTPATSQQSEADKKAAEQKAKDEAAAKKAQADAEAKKKAQAEAQQKQQAAAPAPSTNSGSSSTQSQGSNSNLPSTGPDTAVAAGLFAATTAIATAAHAILTRRRLAR